MDPSMTVLIYVDTSKQVGDPEHLSRNAKRRLTLFNVLHC